MEYSKKLKDPRWQKLRLKVLERDEWACQNCFDTKSMLSVHHLYYTNDEEPWDYPMEAFITLCSECHSAEREKWPRVEQELLFILKKKGFLVKDVLDITEGFKQAKVFFSASVTSSTIKWALKSPKVFNAFGDLYFEGLKMAGNKKPNG